MGARLLLSPLVQHNVAPLEAWPPVQQTGAHPEVLPPVQCNGAPPELRPLVHHTGAPPEVRPMVQHAGVPREAQPPVQCTGASPWHSEAHLWQSSLGYLAGMLGLWARATGTAAAQTAPRMWLP